MASLLFSFQGRINRAKFWLVDLGMIVVATIISAILIGGAELMSADAERIVGAIGWANGAIGAIVLVLVAWILLAIAVKRWHDRNKSGWWMLINLVPGLGNLWYLIECGFLRGTTGPNIYGPDPLFARYARLGT